MLVVLYRNSRVNRVVVAGHSGLSLSGVEVEGGAEIFDAFEDVAPAAIRPELRPLFRIGRIDVSRVARNYFLARGFKNNI